MGKRENSDFPSRRSPVRGVPSPVEEIASRIAAMESAIVENYNKGKHLPRIDTAMKLLHLFDGDETTVLHIIDRITPKE